MAGKISDLPAAGAAGATDELEIIQLDPGPPARVVNRRVTVPVLRGVDDRALAAAIPAAAVAGGAGRPPSVRAVLAALALADGRPVWGQDEQFAAAAGAVAGDGEYRRAEARELELGALSAAEAAVLAAAGAVRIAGTAYHAAVTAHGTGIAHRLTPVEVPQLPAAGQAAGWNNVVTGRSVQGGGISRLQCRAVTGLAAGSIVSLSDMARSTSPRPTPLTPVDRFRVVAVDAAARTIDVRDPDGVQIYGSATGAWTQWDVSARGRPDSDLEIVSVRSTWHASPGADVVRLATAGTPPAAGDVVALSYVTGLAGAWPVYAAGADYLDLVVARDHQVSVAAGHATRVTAHVGADLPAVLPDPLEVAVPDTLVSLRHAQSEATRIAQIVSQSQAQRSTPSVVRTAHVADLWRMADARPADPFAAAAGAYGDGGWTTVPAGWSESPAAARTAGGGDTLWHASATAAYASGSWAFGVGRVTQADAYYERYALTSSGAGAHAVPTAADRWYSRRDPVTTAWGPWVEIARVVGWQVIETLSLHSAASTHYPDAHSYLVSTVDWDTVEFCLFTVRMLESVGGAMRWESSVILRPRWRPTASGANRNSPLYVADASIALFSGAAGLEAVRRNGVPLQGDAQSMGSRADDLGVMIKFLGLTTGPWGIGGPDPAGSSSGIHVYELSRSRVPAVLEVAIR